jgi:hypothetical protein
LPAKLLKNWLLNPLKKKRTKKGISNDLTEQEVEHNKGVGSERIYFEHANSRMKRYRILEHRNRLK